MNYKNFLQIKYSWWTLKNNIKQLRRTLHSQIYWLELIFTCIHVNYPFLFEYPLLLTPNHVSHFSQLCFLFLLLIKNKVKELLCLKTIRLEQFTCWEQTIFITCMASLPTLRSSRPVYFFIKNIFDSLPSTCMGFFFSFTYFYIKSIVVICNGFKMTFNDFIELFFSRVKLL